jgi:hypothetical protein
MSGKLRSEFYFEVDNFGDAGYEDARIQCN